MRFKNKFVFVYAVALLSALSVFGIRDESNQERWDKPLEKGLEAGVPGFLDNLGPTGARAILRANSFQIKYVFQNSPAYGKLEINDVVIGANGKPFGNHTFGGDKNIGIEGPIYDLGVAIEDAEGSNGKLTLQVQRGGSKMNVVVQLEKLGRFSSTFPENCAKSKLLHKRALDYLATNPGMGPDGRCAAILALISSEHKSHQAAGQAMVQKYRVPGGGTWSWNLAFQAIAMAEYHLLTQDRSVLPVLDATLKLISKAQYRGPGIRRWRAKEGEDQAQIDKHTELYDGGFGHAPFKNGYDVGGYGPMQSPTILSVLAWQLGRDCGLTHDKDGIKRALKFMDYGTNSAGNVAYGGEFTLAFGIRDPVKFKNGMKNGNSAKSGLSILAYNLTPEYEKSESYIKLHRSNINACYKGMNNGHADGIMAMTWGVLGTGASGDDALKRKVFDYLKIFLNVTRCHGSKNYVALPGRDYADGAYYRDANRSHVTAMAALLYSFYNPKLQCHGVQVAIPGVNHRELKAPLSTAYQQIIEGKYGTAARAIKENGISSGSPGERMIKYLDTKAKILTSNLEKDIEEGHWMAVQKTFAELKPYWSGVPHFYNRLNYFQSLVADAGGAQLLKADIAWHSSRFGPALLLSKSAEKEGGVNEVKDTAAKVSARIAKEADDHALKLKYMEVRGEWYTLFLELRKIPKTWGGIEKIDTLSKKLSDPFNTPTGKALAATHKFFLDGNYASSYKTALLIKQKGEVSRHKKIAEVLEKKILEKASEKITELDEIKAGGAWYTLYQELTKNKKLYAGIKEFDTYYNKNLALIKSSAGKALASSEKLLRGQKFSLAAKGLQSVVASAKMPQDVKDIASSVLNNINTIIEPEISALVKLEEAGDWYTLQQNLGKMIRDYNGIEAFDEKRKHWDENIRKPEIGKVINAGREFATLRKSWQKGKTASRKRKLEKFADSNAGNLYGRKAKELVK